jgi:hypothetical protein
MSERLARAAKVETDVGTALDHAAWATASPIKIERYWSGEPAPLRRQAEARVLWSSEALHVLFVGRQHEALVVNDAPQTQKKSLGLWERDVCEIFIAPDAERPERYFEFEAAPTGEWLDLAIEWRPEGRKTDWDYASGMCVAASIEHERVRIAMRLPWHAFGRKPRAGELWRVNLFRCIGAGPDRGYLAWSPTRTPQPNFHVPEAFGRLVFGD